MRTLAALVALSFSFALHAAPTDWLNKEVPQLVLASGKTYTKVKFTKIEPDAVTISHAAGISRIRMEDLTEEGRTALGYDPEAAAQARAKFEAEQRAALQKQQAAIQQRQAAQQEIAAAKAKQEQIKKDSRRGTFKVGQVLPEEGGYLVYGYSRGGRAGSFASAVRLAGGGGGGGGYVPPRTDSTPIFLRGSTGTGTVDDEILEVRYIETEETFSYESLSGTRTVKVYELIAVEAE